jgi:di/tricarboxylate transporter
MPTLAIAIFVAVFAIATLRNIHLGVLMLPAAVAVGVGLAGMSIREVLAEFPVHILILIGGVTYFFGIAQANGTVDAVIHKLTAAVGDRRALLPFLFFLITAGVASMGSSQAGYVMIPLAMAAARRSAVDPMLMGVALNSGMSTGGFAVTSLFGIVTLTQAHEVNIDLDPLTLLAAAAIANLALLFVAAWMFPGPGRAVATPDSAIETPATAARARFAPHQVVTLVFMVVLILTIVIGFWLLFEPDPTKETRTDPAAATAALGLIPFGLGAVLAAIWPNAGAQGIRRMDWSTIFMVGAIVMFVGVLQHMNADTLLADAAKDFSTPLVRAFLICAIAGLVSAFASTTSIITLLVPLAVPLAVSGDVAGWALMCALGVSASIVDASPFSTTGALILAAAGESERPRLKSLLMRWGLSMVLVGPAAAVIVLALLAGP